MKVGEGWWGVLPVDWDGDAFRAQWDITIQKRDTGPKKEDPGAVAAVGKLDRLFRPSIRSRFQERFSAGAMARDYVKIYQELAVSDGAVCVAAE